MRRFAAWLAVGLCVSALASFSDQDFSRWLPADTSLYAETRHLPNTIERLADSPLGKSVQEVNWQQAVLFLTQLSDPSEEESLQEIKAVMTSVGEQIQLMFDHVSGSAAVSVSGIESVFDVFEDHQELRAEFLLKDIVEEDIDGADPVLMAQLEREKELDAQELASVLGTVSLLIEVTGSDALETQLADLAAGVVTSDDDRSMVYHSEEIHGTRVHSLRPPPSERRSESGLYWFVNDGVWAIAFTESRIHRLALLQKTPPPTSLATSPSFRTSRDSYQNSDSIAYLDLTVLDRILRRVVEETDGLPSAGSRTPEYILDWLALDAMLPIFQAGTLEDEGIRVRGQLGFSRETAVSRLLFDPSPLQIPTPSFIHREFPQFNVTHWHIGRFWTRLEKELVMFSPEAAAGLGMVRMLMAGQLGFDIKLQFFDHLESGLVFVQSTDPEVMQEMKHALETGDANRLLAVNSRHPTGGQNYLIGFQLKNEAAVRESIDRLLMRFFPNAPPEVEQVEGIDLINPIPPGMGGGKLDEFIKLAFIDGWFVLGIGHSSLLEDAIRASGDEALQIWQDPGFKSIRAKLPARITSLQYADATQQKDALLMMQSSLTFLAENPNTPLPDFQPLGNFMSRILQTSTREGLKITTESFTELQPSP